jgi:hypothetical protein
MRRRCFSAQAATTTLLVGLIAANLGFAQDRPAIEAWLSEGSLAEAERMAKRALDARPAEDQARFELGMVRFLMAVERLAQGLHRHGAGNDDQLRTNARQLIPFLRLPVPPNPNPQPIDLAKFRALLERFRTDALEVEKLLSELGKGEVLLPLRVGMIRMDLNADNKPEPGETFWRIFSGYTGGRVSETDARNFVIRFDRADAVWLQGYCHLLAAMADMILAHDLSRPFTLAAPVLFPDPKRVNPFRSDAFADSIIDSIALVHSLEMRVIEPERLKRARGHLLSMIRLSRVMWDEIAAEKDTELEWIPAPHQTGAIPGVRVNEEMVRTWKVFLDESERALEGKTLVPHWRLPDDRGINLRRLFDEPVPFDLVNWIHGVGLADRVEKGERMPRDLFNRLENVFRGQFIGFAIWFN